MKYLIIILLVFSFFAAFAEGQSQHENSAARETTEYLSAVELDGLRVAAVKNLLETKIFSEPMKAVDSIDLCFSKKGGVNLASSDSDTKVILDALRVELQRWERFAEGEAKENILDRRVELRKAEQEGTALSIRESIAVLADLRRQSDELKRDQKPEWAEKAKSVRNLWKKAEPVIKETLDRCGFTVLKSKPAAAPDLFGAHYLVVDGSGQKMGLSVMESGSLYGYSISSEDDFLTSDSPPFGARLRANIPVPGTSNVLEAEVMTTWSARDRDKSFMVGTARGSSGGIDGVEAIIFPYYKEKIQYSPELSKKMKEHVKDPNDPFDGVSLDFQMKGEFRDVTKMSYQEYERLLKKKE